MIAPHKTLESRCRENMRRLFETYTAHVGISTSLAGAWLLNERGTFRRLLVDNKNSFRVAAYDGIVARFVSVWPPGLEWPLGIEPIHESDLPWPAPRFGLTAAEGEGPADDPLTAERARLVKAAIARGIPLRTVDDATDNSED